MHPNLKDLSADELLELKARIDAMCVDRENKNAPTQRELLAGVIRDQLRGVGTNVMPKAAISAAGLKGKWEAAADRISSYVETHISSKRAEGMHAYVILIQMLIRHLSASGVPATHRNVIVNLEKVPALVDRQFPGYRENGLLPVIVKRTKAA